MKRWLILFTISLVLSGAASASVQQGDTELDFTAGFSKLNGNDGLLGEDVDDIFIAAGLGYFISDNIQLGVSAGASWAEADDTNVDTYSVGVFGKYHFMPTNLWVPYVGAQIDWVSDEVDAPGTIADSKDDGIMWGPLVGVRYELNAYNDFYIQYEYQIFEGDLRDFWDDGHLFVVGIIHQFK